MIYFHISVYCTIGPTFITLCCFFFFPERFMHATLPDHVMTLHPKPSPRTKSQPFFLFLTPESPAVMLEAPFLFVNEILLRISAPQKKKFPSPPPNQVATRLGDDAPARTEREKAPRRDFYMVWCPFSPLEKRKKKKKRRKIRQTAVRWHAWKLHP